MTRLVLLLATSSLAASPVLAQQATPEPPAACAPEHAAMGHCTPAPAAPPADPHAGHQMPVPETKPAPAPTPAPDPHAGHQMPQPEPAPAPAPTPAPDPHAGHDMTAAPAEVPVAPAPLEASAGPENAADQVWGRGAMEQGRAVLFTEHGDLPAYRFFIDRAETRIRNGRDGYVVDGQAWFGGDIDKAWFKGEVEGDWGKRPEHVEAQALWSHAIDPWFDLQAGVRYDPQPGPDRAHLVVGVQGLAPYWWEVDGALFLSNKGEVTARAEAEYDLRITQKLILQPRVELDFSLQDIAELGIGAGLSQAALGARLRYQISPLFAPYAGIEYQRAFGGTADFRRADGEKVGSLNLLAGVQFWF